MFIFLGSLLLHIYHKLFEEHSEPVVSDNSDEDMALRRLLPEASGSSSLCFQLIRSVADRQRGSTSHSASGWLQRKALETPRARVSLLDPKVSCLTNCC